MAKRANGEGTIKHRSDGRWEAQIVLGTDPTTGKIKRKSIYGKTQKEVKQKLREIAEAVDTGTFTNSKGMTLENWMNEWLETYCISLKPSTYQTYSRKSKYIIRYFGKAKLESIRPHNVQKFINSLALSSKTVSCIHGVLHKALDQAQRNGLISINPADRTALPKKEKPEIKPFDDDKINEFLLAIKNNRYENVLLLALFTGMRQGELLGLKWKSISFEKSIIKIENQLQLIGGEYIDVSPKHDKIRIIAVPDFVINALKSEQLKQKKVEISVLWTLGKFRLCLLWGLT